MNNLLRSFGGPMTAVILLLAGTWIFGLIAGPQLIMIEQSLWRMEQGEGGAEISARIDRLYNRIDILTLDKMDMEDKPPSGERDSALAEFDENIARLSAEIDGLEAQETTPRKVYSTDNYRLMGAAHLAIFAKTVVASLAVTAIAFCLCYPIAYTVAKLAPPGRAAMIMLALTVPYAINELLRIFAWQMILNYNGLANTLLGVFGFEPVPFLESGSGVFVAMVYAYVLFMVFPIYNTIETLDANQIEAAKDLGAGTWSIHTKVVLPHARPGIAVGCIMTFMLSAGSYAVPYIMTRGTADPWFTQLIYNKFFESTNWNAGAAYAFTLLAVCVVFIFLMMKFLKVRLQDIAK
ncbi:MAG: ABC transporter permease [Roseovarius sp.]|nr:ABC transporter permease [Roseovarius sp.]